MDDDCLDCQLTRNSSLWEITLQRALTLGTGEAGLLFLMSGTEEYLHQLSKFITSHCRLHPKVEGEEDCDVIGVSETLQSALGFPGLNYVVFEGSWEALALSALGGGGAAAAAATRNSAECWTTQSDDEAISDANLILVDDGRTKSCPKESEKAASCDGERFFCPMCRKRFPKRRSRDKHIARIHKMKAKIVMPQERPHPCDLCDNTFAHTSTLRRHVRQKHKDQPEAEDMLSQITDLTSNDLGGSNGGGVSAAVDDEESSVGRAPFPCPLCLKQFPKKRSRDKHVWGVHKKPKKSKDEIAAAEAEEDQTCLCQECGKEFAKRKNLLEHIRIHHKEKDGEHVCTVCGKVYTRRKKLVMHHKRSHQEEKQFPCQTCGVLIKPSTQKVHMVRIHGHPLPHICEQCGKGFLRCKELRRHIQAVHLKERPYHCDFCASTFARPSNMYRHIRAKHQGAARSALAGVGRGGGGGGGGSAAAGPTSAAGALTGLSGTAMAVAHEPAPALAELQKAGACTPPSSVHAGEVGGLAAAATAPLQPLLFF